MRQTYHIIPGPRLGLVTPEILANIARVALKYNIPLLKITSGQRLSFVGLDPADLKAISAELGDSPPKPAGSPSLQACPGLRHCRHGQQDALQLAERVQEELLTMTLPAKTKIGISGCARNCCESFVRDMGIFGRKKGWTLVFGGNAGGRPRIGDIIAADLDDCQVIDLAKKCLAYYQKEARPKERTARFMERTTLQDFKEAVRGAIMDPEPVPPEQKAKR